MSAGFRFYSRAQSQIVPDALKPARYRRPATGGRLLRSD
jgi:hypothetical protein